MDLEVQAPKLVFCHNLLLVNIESPAQHLDQLIEASSQSILLYNIYHSCYHFQRDLEPSDNLVAVDQPVLSHLQSLNAIHALTVVPRPSVKYPLAVKRNGLY
jgi:hypothetical protein